MASAKARRLLAAGKVMPAGTAEVFTVQGDTGVRTVVLGDGFSLCDCPSPRFVACTHIEAALLLSGALADERRGAAA
jgi:hypothetical protein